MAAPSLFQIRVSASNVVVVAGDGFVWLPICWCTMLEVQTGLVMTQFQARCCGGLLCRWCCHACVLQVRGEKMVLRTGAGTLVEDDGSLQVAGAWFELLEVVLW